MIITDLDNTLLNKEGKITEYSKLIFSKCKERGIIIVFATEKSCRNTQKLFGSIKPHATICHCGGLVSINDIMCAKYLIPFDYAQNIIKLIMKNHEKINIGIECGNSIYANFDIKMYWKNVSNKTLDLNKMPSRNIYKIVVGLEQIKYFDMIQKDIPNGFYIEKLENKAGIIMNKSSTKWNGIKSLLISFGIKEDNIVSFGDDDVDIEIIEKSGIGIAVENGNEKIKSKAKYICKNNDEDGVAKWIEKNILTLN
ncbi:MAG: HAD family hydrolase [Treponema sp.]|nr:HAD family hydrolase [Treponema sp.]